ARIPRENPAEHARPNPKEKRARRVLLLARCPRSRRRGISRLRSKSGAHRARLERRATVFDVDGETHLLRAVLLNQGFAIANQGLAESLIGEAFDVLATLDLRLNELFEDPRPILFGLHRLSSRGRVRQV